MDRLTILDGSGHVELTWDPASPEDVARARVAVDKLKAAGYWFAAVVRPTTEAIARDFDPVAVGRGRLICEWIDDPIRPPEQVAIAEPTPTDPVAVESPRRRGRPSKPSTIEPTRETIARPPMRGGGSVWRSSATESVLNEISAERIAQDSQWGGDDHDDGFSVYDWLGLIRKFHDRAYTSLSAGSFALKRVDASKYRRRLVQIAALAVAAIEAYDRQNPR